MKVKGLDGREYSWNIHSSKKRASCSSYHKSARSLLKQMFSFDVIAEELTLPGSKKLGQTQPLFADFYINSQKLMVEVHGEQHYSYNKHFFDNKLDFLKAQARDKQKKEWCQINGITLVELPYDESTYQWEQRIINAVTTKEI